jgi:hypothetical protein
MIMMPYGCHWPRRRSQGMRTSGTPQDDLDMIQWSDLAYGTGSNPVPARLTCLAYARTDQGWNEQHLDLLNTVLPSGTCRRDTGPAVTVLMRAETRVP